MSTSPVSPASSVSPASPVESRSSARRWLTLLLWAALLVGLPVAVTVILGRGAYQLRDYPGPQLGPITALVRGVADAAGLLTAGAITSMMFLQRVRATRSMELMQVFEATTMRRASAWWFTSSVVMVLLDGVDSLGVSPRVFLRVSDLVDLVGPNSYARAWMLSAVCAACVYVSTWVMHRWWHLVIPLVAATVGGLAPVVVGAVLVGPNHDFGSDAAIILTCLTGLFAGSTLVLTLRRLNGRAVTDSALRRWSGFGIVAGPAMIVAELVIVWFKLAGTSPVASLAGDLSIVRLLCLVVLTAMALLTRSDLRSGAADPSRWLSAASFAVVLSVAAQVAMTRFLSPQFLVESSISQAYLGFDLPQAPSPSVLLFSWRPNILFVTTAVGAAVAYALGLRRLHRQGDSWPVLRSVAWFSGCLVLVVATSSGLGHYAGADFAIHMGVHMLLNMVAPILLVLGGPLTLALRVTRPSTPPGPHEWLVGAINSPLARAMYHPIPVLIVFVGSYYGLYLTGLFEAMSRDHWAHQLMNIHFVLIGMLYYGLIIGVDRTPYQLPHVARLGYVFAAMPFHAFFGVIVMSSDRVIAYQYYSYLDPSWAGDLLRNQYIGGGIAWAGGEIPLLMVVIVLVAQWTRSDSREARRKDRHFDTGRDDEFETYNRMLQQLAARDDHAPRRVEEMSHDDR